MNPVIFLSEVRSELGKVTWPGRNDTIRYTAIVIAISVFIGIYLGIADYIFTVLLQYLVK